MNKKKIRVCFPFIGDSIGGSHLSAIELIKKLDNKKFEIKLLLHKKGILYDYLIKEGFKPFFLKTNLFVGKKKGIIINLLGLFINIIKILPFIKKNNIDIVHLNDSSAGLSWIIPITISKAKLIWHQRIVFPKWGLYKVLSFFPDKIICVSSYVYRSLPQFSKNKSVKIFDPVSVKQNDNNDLFLKKRFFINNNEKRILFLANIIENKKIDVFIKNAKIITKLNSSIKFYIVGSNKKKLLKKKTLKEFKNKIIYVGQTRNISFWFKNCDLLLVTAENEGFNRTIAEGMLSKIPIIAINSGAHNEIIKNDYNGWLVNSGNIEYLSKLSLKVLNLKKIFINKILETAKSFVRKKYEPTTHAKKVSKVYRELV